MRMGIMGGTLDPVHNGHLEIAGYVREVCALDGVVLLPAGDPPHKRRLTNRSERLEMARLAASTLPWMEVSDAEILREGTTYTVDTLSQMHAEHADVEWVYIVGADTLNVLESWRDFERVAKLCSFAVIGRSGVDEGEAAAHAQMLERRFGAKVRILPAAGPEISSTMIRQRIAKGFSIAGLVPAEVEAYIRRNGLYLCGCTWDELERRLEAKLKPSRLRHTLGVAQTAMRLAERFGVDPQRARLAAMLHDCAKCLPYGDQLVLAQMVGDADDEELALEAVVHASAGMALAKRDFGVRDPEILSAIRKHTLGDGHMTPLELLIFVSDFIEPTRAPFDGLEEVRALAETDLRAAAKRSARLSNEYVLRRGGRVHPRTAALIEE